jgi:Ca2+-binding RTX toxin-like protein
VSRPCFVRVLKNHPFGGCAAPAGGIKILSLLERSTGSGDFSSPRGGPKVRRVVILLAVIAVAVAVGGGAALAKTIRCDGGNCFGTNHADTIYGTNRHDAIFAKDGSDFVSGRGKDDNLHGQDGNDRVLGGLGDDWVKGGRHGDTVKGDEGNDRLTGGPGRNVIRAGDGMRDLIICGDNSRNLIYYDPHLDRFRNCVFVDSLEASAQEEESSASIIGLGPSHDSGSGGSTDSP